MKLWKSYHVLFSSVSTSRIVKYYAIDLQLMIFQCNFYQSFLYIVWVQASTTCSLSAPKFWDFCNIWNKMLQIVCFLGKTNSFSVPEKNHSIQFVWSSNLLSPVWYSPRSSEDNLADFMALTNSVGQPQLVTACNCFNFWP